MWATFNRFELQLTKQQAKSCYHPGDCELDLRCLLADPKIKRQFKLLDPKLIGAELKEYGAWSDVELEDIVWNQLRILWIATGNIMEECE